MNRWLHKVKTVIRIIRTDGFSECCKLIENRVITRFNLSLFYKRWIRKNENKEEIQKDLEYTPLISVVVPVYNVAKDVLIECIESVVNQTYSHWELCLVDDCSSLPEVRQVLKVYETNQKIKIKYRTENGHISKTTNDGIEMSTGEFIALLDCDDLLSANALYEVAKFLNGDKQYDYIYSDEDKISEKGYRYMPFFKPDWSPDTLMSMMYTCHLSVYRKNQLIAIGGLRSEFDGAQDYDLVLRFTEQTDRIGHIAKILYHWRESKTSTALNIDSKPYIFAAMKKAKEEAIRRRGQNAVVQYDNQAYQYTVVYQAPDDAVASIIIPSKDHYSMWKNCIESIRRYTQPCRYEIITVDNGSNEEQKKLYEELCYKYNIRYIYDPDKFNFSAMCNKGAKQATGEFLLFLNDDIEVISEQWIEKLMGHAALEHIGAVGAKLLYPNSNIIQHTGVVNLNLGPSHCLTMKADSSSYYFGRNKLNYNYIAVTGACLMVKKDIFVEAKGFDELFPIGYNDVELCFRLLQAGRYNVIRNDVVLYHHESISRGNDLEDKEKLQRLGRELEHLYDLHPQFRGHDPFYNVNLTQKSNDYSINCE